MGSPAIVRLLKNREFLKLWGNQILLQIAFNICNYTALLILANKTHSPFIQAVFYTSLTIPSFVFGLIAGPIVDVTDRKKLMLVTDFLMAILFFAYSFTKGSVLGIVLIGFATSSVARFFIPAEAATMPLVVDAETLDHANTFFLFTLMGSLLLGYAIAGPIIQMSGGLGSKGESSPFFVAGVMLIIGFLLRVSLKHITHTKPQVVSGSIFKKTFVLFQETVVEVRENRPIALSLTLLIFVELMIGLLSVVILEYVRRFLLLPLTSVSYILMLPLIGGLLTGVGALGIVQKRYGYKKSILVSMAVTGIVLSLLGALPMVLAKTQTAITSLRISAIISSFVLGIVVVFISVQSRTLLQKAAKSEMHGRIFSFLDVMIAFVTPIPVLTLGLLADKVSLLATLVFIGICIIGLSLVSVFAMAKKRA